MEKKRDYILEGLAVPFGELNTNDRIYFKESYILENGTNIFEEFKKRVDAGEVLGTIGRDSLDNYENIPFEEASHKVIDVTMKPDGIYVKLQVLDTPKGNTLKTIINMGMMLFVSQRACGSTTPNNIVHVDTIYSYDVVTNSSFTVRGKPLTLKLTDHLDFLDIIDQDSSEIEDEIIQSHENIETIPSHFTPEQLKELDNIFSKKEKRFTELLQEWIIKELIPGLKIKVEGL